MNIRKLKQNKIKLYGYWFFHNLILAYVIERLYWESRGINIQEVVYLEIIYALVVSILEIPTGYLADKWSRKGMMIIGAICTCFEFGILIIANDFLFFALAVFIAAIGNAVTSGTSNALLYDSMKISCEEEQFEKVLGRLTFFDGFAHATGALCGGIVATKFNLVTNYYLSLISTIIALLISFTFYEPIIKTKEEKEKNNSIKQTITFLKNNLSVLIVLLNGLVVSSTLIYIDEFWQIYLRDISFPIVLFGVVSVSLSFVGSIGSLISARIKKIFGYKKSILLILILYLVGLLGLGIFNNIYGVIFLLIAYFPTGTMETLVNGYLHNHAESEYRATAESFSALFHRIFSILIGLLFGYIASKYTVLHGYLLLACMILVFIIAYLGLLKKKIIEK